MATLYEYFKKDQGQSLTVHNEFEIRDATGAVNVKLVGRLHIDLEANALYVSFFIPSTTKVSSPARFALNAVNEVIGWREQILVSGGLLGEDRSSNSECVFTGRIYIYSEDTVGSADKEYILQRSRELGHTVKFREQSYADHRNRYEKPVAFISHDSKDKDAIAGPLALAMQKLLCPVWYDEYSLKVGDSLREQIEKGLRECKKCILVLTPNFLANEGWGKKEFDSIFTRELIETQKVILPVWHEVSKEDVYRYSPALADRVAANWKDGVDVVARKLMSAIS